MLNLSVLLEDGARNRPERDAIVFGDMRLNYALVNMIANQVANLLVSRGIRPGDKVALACPNVPYFPFVYFGALKAGAVVVPLNVLLTPREIEYHLRDSGAKALFAFTGTPELPSGSAPGKHSRKSPNASSTSTCRPPRGRPRPQSRAQKPSGPRSTGSPASSSRCAPKATTSQ